MDEKAKEEIQKEAIEYAQKVARDQGLTPGQVVAHPDDPVTHKLKDIKGDVATVLVKKPSRAGEVEKQFPLDELFDPNVAERRARELFDAALSAKQEK